MGELQVGNAQVGEVQPGILEPVPKLARHLFFTLAPGGDARAALARLAALLDGRRTVAGFGASLAAALGTRVPGLAVFPCHAGPGVEVPSTPEALWCWLRGEDRGELVHRSRAIELAAAPGLSLARAIDSFEYAGGRDLSGYEDGTENPTGGAAIDAAVLRGAGAGLDGSSFAAVQQWVHDLGALARLSPGEQDLAIGRRRQSNEEIDDAPPSAHVKRTAQESFDPPAFVLRRSMPWADERRAGLVFVAFGRSFDAFEAQLCRMAGAEDGVADALFRFTQPVSGGYFWCPPGRAGGIDLSVLGAPAA